MSTVRTGDHGALLWDFLDMFLKGRRGFLSLQRRYDRRVLKAARARGVDRMELKLPPDQLFALFHLARLELLRDRRLEPLRRMATRIFGEEGDVGLMDVYCGHIYHEVSILSREHRSVGRFVRRKDPRRYRALFDEVSGYYPERLRRVKRFFMLAMKRLDELLPVWAEQRVVVRSIYLFGDELSRRAWGRGREEFYKRMYPEGGAVRGYAAAAASFAASGFTDHAREAVAATKEAARVVRARRTLRRAERTALAEAKALGLSDRRKNRRNPRATAAESSE